MMAESQFYLGHVGVHRYGVEVYSIKGDSEWRFVLIPVCEFGTVCAVLFFV